MRPFNRRTRLAVALATAAAIAAAYTATAGATPLQTAALTDYTDATFLQHALGLPATDTNPVIEPVTYDRFQWQLQQAGNFAVLIGDPFEDPSFAARAQDVETAAKAAGVAKVYWFDPNLSGNATVGSVIEPNLDIRNPALITSVTAGSRTTYGKDWLNLVGQYLGNGVTATTNNPGGESGTITATTGTGKVNDYGSTAGHSTEVGNTSGGALYDYTSITNTNYTNGSVPANVTHSFFLIYNKDHTDGGQPAKIVSWVDLTGEANSGATLADVTTAINTAGASNLTEIDQFAWWKSAGNFRNVSQNTTPAVGSDIPLLTDADNADGWRVDQITYPELVDLLKNGADDDNAVILFGGTWCPNTRPVLPAINKYAQQNDVTVFDFDTVLDGGYAGGSTTGSGNPLQIRNTAGTLVSGVAPNPAVAPNPTFLYGDLVSQYLNNLETEYNPATTYVSYYPGNNTSGTLTKINKLQVPYVIGYKGSTSSDPHGGVTRQWIIDHGDSTFTEYMSSWQYTNPQPFELGLGTGNTQTTIPSDAAIWSSLNAALGTLTWQTDPNTLYPDTTVDTDDGRYLGSGVTDTAAVTFPSGSVSVAVPGTSGTIPVTPAALSTALSHLGVSGTPANLVAAKSAVIAAKASSASTLGDLTTVYAAWYLAQKRKSQLLTRLGSATSPGSVLGGVAAVHALDVFFGGLPLASTQTVTANAVTAGTAPEIDIAIGNDAGRTPTGIVSLVVKKDGVTVATGVDRGREQRGLLRAPGPRSGYVRLHAVVRG